jgi:hypothetical protein
MTRSTLQSRALCLAPARYRAAITARVGALTLDNSFCHSEVGDPAAPQVRAALTGNESALPPKPLKLPPPRPPPPPPEESAPTARANAHYSRRQLFAKAAIAASRVA